MGRSDDGEVPDFHGRLAEHLADLQRAVARLQDELLPASAALRQDARSREGDALKHHRPDDPRSRCSTEEPSSASRGCTPHGASEGTGRAEGPVDEAAAFLPGTTVRDSAQFGERQTEYLFCPEDSDTMNSDEAAPPPNAPRNPPLPHAPPSGFLHVLFTPRESLENSNYQRGSGRESTRTSQGRQMGRESSQTTQTHQTTDTSHMAVFATMTKLATEFSGGDKVFKKQKDVFVDKDTLKDKVRLALLKPEYNVTMYYTDEGMWQYIATSSLFENFTMFVIVINALWIAIELDYNDASVLNDAETHFQVIEHAFCAFFTFELLVRFMSFQRKANCMKDGWFVFDAFLAATMVFETWILTLVFAFVAGSGSSSLKDASFLRVARNFRLTRVARVARLLRAVPELLVLLKGMALGLRAVFFTILLMVFFVYLFAILFAQLAKDTVLADGPFKTVPDSMYSLLLGGVLADQESILSDLGAASPLFVALFLGYFLIVVLTVINMLLGVLVDVVNVVSAVEKDKSIMTDVKTRTMRHLGLHKGQEGTMITRKQCTDMLLNPDAAKSLEDIGIDTMGLVDYLEYLFKEKCEVPFGDFLAAMINLRGNEPAKRKDVVELRKAMLSMLNRDEVGRNATKIDST